MPSEHPVTKLGEIEHGLGLLAAEVEDHLQTKPINLLYWQRQLREVIAELQEGRWQPMSGAPRSADRPAGERTSRSDPP